MAISLIPYGLRAGGNYGIHIDDTTGVPLSAVLEVFATLPTVIDTSNFNGRLVFNKADETVYVFRAGVPEWFPLKGIPATVGNVAGSPPITPTPQAGVLYYDLDTEVMFVWDGAAWRPIGGRFASRFIEQKSISNGAAGVGGDTFALGTTPVFGEFVEIYLDGIRQVTPSDYTVIGANAVFPAPVPVNVEVFSRTVESTILQTPGIQANAQCITVDFLNQLAGLTLFGLGAGGMDPQCAFVYKNGLLLLGGGTDYVYGSADTTITGIVKLTGTTARVTTLTIHGAAIGNVVTLIGAAEVEYKGSFTILAIQSPTEFDITVLASAPASATQANGGIPLSFSPPMFNDTITLNVATALNDDISIRTFQRIIVAPSSGEANTMSNLGTGVGIFSTKTGVDLRLKTLEAGPNIQIVDIGNELQISSNAGATFEGRNGINTTLHLMSTTESYIGVRDTSATVTIDLSTVVDGPSGSGRKITVCDESGGATAKPIQVSHGGRLFNNAPSPFQITSSNGSVTLVYDGTDWHVTAKTF